MTREEAIKLIKALKNGLHETGKDFPYRDEIIPVAKQALDTAIKALEQEPFKPMVEIDLYSVIQQKYIERDVLDKIRGEIKTMGGDIETIADVLTIIDKYRAQSEE